MKSEERRTVINKVLEDIDNMQNTLEDMGNPPRITGAVKLLDDAYVEIMQLR